MEEKRRISRDAGRGRTIHVDIDGDTVQVSRDLLLKADAMELGALFAVLAEDEGVRWLELVS